MNAFIIIPAYNEASRVGSVISDIIKRYGQAYRVVVVDDGSADATAAIAQAAGAQVLRQVVNRGQGAALQTGTDYALAQGAQLIVHFDADGQHEAADIIRLVEPIARGEVEVVLGSRFISEKRKVKNENLKFNFFKLPIIGYSLLATKQIPFLRRILLLGSLITNYLIAQLPLSDVHNGLRAMNARAARRLRLSQDGMAHNTEYAQLIRKYQLVYTEVPVKINYNQSEKQSQNFFDGLKILKQLAWKLFVKF